MRFTVHHHETLASTQILAKEWCDEGQAKIGDVIQADIQTGGYGRRGRNWQSPPGNLYFTLIEDFNDPSHLTWLSFAMGLALYDAVRPCVPAEIDVFLKWPNDVLVNGGKLSGILLEVLDQRMIIGVGVNIAVLPDTDQNTASVNAYATEMIAPRDMLTRILTAYETWHAVGVAQGFQGLREAWLSRAAFKGETITARLANNETFQGVFIDLDPHGALVLQTECGRRLITSADIYLPR